ncbi:DUF1150 family protein [Magnetospirillum sp. UT-4]|uniref:DUF1150 family protein n=1 Tax=Magnetospirillum sp. UT-4 TaxID=2681467 RepID=UPI001381C503|nr:DUF1150 family protein [Magnetospirillum sp. UT-4]CAA7624407.1 conserved hypothetical protein [Magnetospirillum sp. UT-4]
MNEHNHVHQPQKAMSAADFASWGMPHLAFVKRVELDEQVGWSIHAADGTHMGLAPSRDLAFAAIRQHELEPVSVH